MPDTSNRIRNWIVSGLLCLLILIALKNGFSSFIATPSTNLLNTLNSAPDVDTGVMEDAINSADLALFLNQGKPDYLDGKGMLCSWALARKHAAPLCGNPDTLFQLYRDSIKKRPGWPYSWGNLAYSKAITGKIDEEFNHAFRRALKLGASEQQLLLLLIVSGLTVWPQLNEPGSQLVMEAIQNSLDVNPHDTSQLINAHRKMARVCARLPAKYRKQSYCRDENIL